MLFQIQMKSWWEKRPQTFGQICMFTFSVLPWQCFSCSSLSNNLSRNEQLLVSTINNTFGWNVSSQAVSTGMQQRKMEDRRHECCILQLEPLLADSSYFLKARKYYCFMWPLENERAFCVIIKGRRKLLQPLTSSWISL